MALSTSRLFWGWMSGRYVAQPIADPESYARKLALTQERLRPDWDLLELGCGSGNTALSHAPFVASVTATDYCTPLMEHGIARARDEGVSNITFREMDVTDLPTDARYDAVLMLNLLHLLKDWRGAIASVGEITRAGGILVTSSMGTKDAGIGVTAISYMFNMLPFVPYIARFSKAEVLAEMDRAGFDIEVDWCPKDGPTSFVIARKRA